MTSASSRSRSGSSSSSSGSSRTGSTGGSGGGSNRHGSTSVEITNESVGVSHNGTGATVSAHGVEVEREFEIWSHSSSFPTPIPGVNFIVRPEVTGSVSGGLDRQDGRTEFSVGAAVEGHIGIGLSGGIPNVAEVYITAGPTVRGSAQATFDSQGLKECTARIDISASAEVGVSVGGGTFDLSYELGSVDICSFIGLRYQRGQGVTNRGTFQLSGPMRAAMDFLRAALQRARQLGSAAATAVTNAYHGAREYAASGLSAAYNALPSW